MCRTSVNVLYSLTETRIRLWMDGRFFGLAWWLVEPLLLSMCYVFLVKVAMRAGSDQYALFLMSAMLPWFWFLRSTSLASESLLRGSRVIKAFPISYWVFPASEVLATSIRFVCSLVVLAPLMLYYRVAPTTVLLWLPAITLVQLTFTLGFGFWLCVANVYIRDTKEVLQLTTRIWFFMSPCLYGVERLPESIRPWYMLNPFAVLFTSYRDVIMIGHAPHFGYLLYVVVLAFMLTASGLRLLHRQQGVLPLRI